MISHQDKHWKPSTGSTVEDFNLVWSYLTTWMTFLAKSEIPVLIKFARINGFETFLYIVEFKLPGPKYRSDSIRNGKSTTKMYFQAAYMNGDCGKISGT